MLERAIAQRNRYPAINLLKSVSHAMPDCNTAAENALVQKGRSLLATYENMAEMMLDEIGIEQFRRAGKERDGDK